jgi:putative adhesin
VAGPVDVAVEHGGLKGHGLEKGVRARVQGDGIVLEEFRGPVDVDAQRAGIELDPAGALVDAVSASATHGAIRLSLPSGSRIDLEAAAQHGEVQVDVPGLALSRSGTERVSGKLGGGGAMVRLTTANGDVRVETPQAVAAQNPQ